MDKQTTLADLLSHVFSELEKRFPVQPNVKKHLFQCWKEVLASESDTDRMVNEKIIFLHKAHERLESQVITSGRIKDNLKKIALSHVKQFDVFFDVKRFNLSVDDIRNLCTSTTWGNLGLLSSSLELEFSEPSLSAIANKDVVESLHALKALVEDSDFPVPLKLNLRKQLDILIWMIDHPEISSVENFYQVLSASIAVAMHGEIITGKSDGSKKESEIKEKLRSVLNATFEGIAKANKGIDGLYQIGGKISDAIDFFTS